MSDPIRQLTEALLSYSLHTSNQTNVSTIPVSTPSLSPLPNQQLLPCPGLIRSVSHRTKWYIPEGYHSSERLYCGYCVKKYNISNSKYDPNLSRNQCNCDSFLLKSGIDNGIFNISVWDPSLRTFYTAENDNTINIPSTKFKILIYRYVNDNKQMFKVTFKNKNGDILHQTCLTRLSVMTPEFLFLNTSDKKILLGLKVGGLKKVLTVNDQIICEIEIYQARDRVIDATDHNFGLVRFNDNLTPLSDEKIVDEFSDKHSLLNFNKECYLFSKKPLIVKLNFNGVVRDMDPNIDTLEKEYLLKFEKDVEKLKEDIKEKQKTLDELTLTLTSTVN